MKYAILLCDKTWHVQKPLRMPPGQECPPGLCLTDHLADPAVLLDPDLFDGQKQRFLVLEFPAEGRVPSILRCYPNHILVFLVHIDSEEEFIAFSNIYTRCTVWAEEALQDYHDEYYQISQMNNRLINSQRALTRANQQYKRLLHQMQDANSLIALLEQDELTTLLRIPALYSRANQRMADHPDADFDMIALNFHSIRTVNELFGRETGDRLLQDLALFLAGLEHAEQGLLAHAAGSVFLLFMPAGLRFYEVLQREASAWLADYPLPLQLRVRIGVCTGRAGNDSAEDLYDHARLALDTLNNTPGESLAFYNERMHDDLILRHKLLDSVPAALAGGQLLLYLQPKVRLDNGQMIGAEALIRWHHPELGFVPPMQFIPLLEKEGGIYAVDRYIWEKACQLLQKRREQGLSRLSVSVNVARSDFYQPDLIKFLLEMLAKYGLDADQLRLEVLERAYVQDSARLFHVLTRLRQHGFIIEMDDFGVGESSLAMLAEMPVDVIKLDRQFLLTAEQVPAHIEVIRCIIQLAKKLGIGIIAEGVETPEQAQLLLSLGCNHAQGYLYGRPEPAENFLKPNDAAKP